MKNWEKVYGAWMSTTKDWKAALRIVGVDPDAEYVEPAKPEAARWVGPKCTPFDPGHYHDDDGNIESFNLGSPGESKYDSENRWHGPHPTEQAAREHYEVTKAPVPIQAQRMTIDEFSEQKSEMVEEIRRSEQVSGQDRATTINCSDHAPRPAAEYDWAVDWLCGGRSLESLAAEAARREREACKAREQQWIDAGVRSVVSIRCLAHRSVPPYNINEMGGGECAACEVEALRAERETEARRADTIVCIANGEDPGGYEDSTAMIAVRALRAERDRMAAELDRTKAAILISNQRATNAIERARVLGDRIGVLEAERDELLWRNANQKRLLEQYQARLRERQPSADLAELVRLAESVDTIVNERRYIDPLFVDQSRLILRLAQAVAGMGGGK